jgi:hypothetical protein
MSEQNPSEQEVVEKVRKYLKDKHPGGANLEALSQGVRHEQEWWYVPVQPDIRPPRRYEYYEALADVELNMLKQEKVTVLLLPTPPEEEAIAA